MDGVGEALARHRFISSHLSLGVHITNVEQLEEPAPDTGTMAARQAGPERVVP